MKRGLFILLVVLGLNVNAQPPSKWYNRFGGAGIDIGYGVKETYKRHYIVAGSTSSFGYGATDAYLILVDSMGQKVWDKTYGGVMADVAKAVVVNPIDSGFIFTGYTGSIGNGGYDVYLVRTDKNGTIIWQQSFGGLDWDFGNDIIIAPDGNILICGYTFNSKYGKKDGYISKINPNNGSIIWEKKYGDSHDDIFTSIISTTDGFISLCGTRTLDGISNDFWLFKVNLNGDSILSKAVTSFSTNEKCYDFMQDKNNQLVFAGALDTSLAMTGKYTSYLVRTDLSGAFLGSISYTNGATNEDKFSTICNTKNQNEFCMVRKVNQPLYKFNCQPFKTLPDFTYLAATTYGDFDDDEIFNIEMCSDNGYILTGSCKSYDAILEDVYLIKLDSTIYGAQSIVGIKENTNTSYEIEFYYYKNKLYFHNSTLEETTISIYNVTGQLIKEGNTNNASFDPQIQKSGIYFAILKQGARSKKLKFIANIAHD
ncbi:MAG: T9SS type A sorting domain-containing protein [Sphingobacteriaceae bacterium]|nr:T9SS type A sorting domain-containing protein [Sphingobacteriaceae bacterium]